MQPDIHGSGKLISLTYRIISAVRTPIIFIILLLGLSIEANADPTPTNEEPPPPYNIENPVPRLALVIGNTSYTTQDTIPSADQDSKLVADHLRRLNFRVTEAHNVRTQTEFYYEFLRPFLDEIQPGSVVIFYFSGHGFSFGGESFLTPTMFPTTVPYSKITSTFMSVTAIRDMISERQPAILLMVLDACRNMTNFIDTSGQTKNRLQTKGLTGPLSGPANTLVWFATDEGRVSLADPDGAPSIYTGVLAKHLNEEDRQIDLVRKIVRLEVMSATQNQQVPWSSESSSAEFWLHPTDRTIEQLKAIWMAALSAGTRDQVQNFVGLYGSSPFAAAARLWLKNHPDAPSVSLGSISPAAPEALWNNRLNAALIPLAGSQSVAFDLGGPLGMVSILGPQATAKLTLTSFARGGGAQVAPSGPSSLPPAVAGPILANQGQLVTRETVVAQQSPTIASAAVFLPSGSLLQVERVIPGPGSSKWLSVTTPGITGPVTVRVPDRTVVSPRPIGTPVKEIVVPPQDGPGAWVPAAPIVKALDAIKSSKKTITWVSIGTPAPSAPTKAGLLSLRATYTIHILTTHGVPREIISTAEGAAPAAMALRLRFFGGKQ